MATGIDGEAGSAIEASAKTTLKDWLEKPGELVLPVALESMEEVDVDEVTPFCTGPQNLWGWLGPKTETRKVKRKKSYDVMLDVSDLEAVLQRQKGWQLNISGASVWKQLKDSQLINVGIVGVFNRGKTT